jgi:S-adenosylmethionine hydrolase
MLITLLTDFGEKDPFVGIMKGVIYGLNPAAQVIDLTHQVSPQAVREGAFLLQNAYLYFPPNTVHVAVVDPGVGTTRKAICLYAPGTGYFVGPDNGLFSYILEKFPNATAREISNPRFHRPAVSATFHGRDVFAPAAAHLTLGEDWQEIGPLLPRESLVRLPDLWPGWVEEGAGHRSISGEIVHVDHFGTLVTSIPALAFEGIGKDRLVTAKISIAESYKLRGLVRTYGEASKGDLVALFGSNGFLEIARVNGQADDLRGNLENPPAWLGQKVILELAG